MRFRFLILTVVAALGPGLALGEVRAVLVGVGDYAVLDADLKGPPADVALMAEVLLTRGVRPSQLRVLVTGGAALPEEVAVAAPTRSGILAVMAGVAAAAVRGDTVVFYFSGHGAQAPDQSGDEGGGYDEILLPSDAEGWNGAAQRVENALLDDELQVWVQGLLDRGVKVVGLIDACHAATGFRAVGGTGVTRALPPEVLGVPEPALVAAGGAADLRGEFVFLYSSQADQRSYEFPLGDSGIWHGAFTLALAAVLRDAPEASWQQVLTAVSAGMARGAVRQVPDGEGPMLGQAVFGSGAGARRYGVRAGRLAAGLLDGLSEGAEVALYAGAAGGEALALAVVGAVNARDAVIVGDVPSAALWAEVVALAPPPELRLGVPVVRDAGDYAGWLAALGPGQGGEVDLVPVLTDGALALVGPDGVLDPVGLGSSPRVLPGPGETAAQALARVLAQAGHSLRLAGVLAGLAGRGLTAAPVLEVAYSRRSGCHALTLEAAVDPAKGLVACDQLWVTVRNVGGRPVDLSMLYFNADFTVSPIWPRQGLSNRLAVGESIRAGLRIQGTGPALEELMILAVLVDPDAARVDLTRLAEPSMTRGFASGSDAVTLWIDQRMRDDGQMRGFSARPAALVLVRQAVRILPGGQE